jgi:PadR family transcriptional regulator, regulatory protein PadR
MQTEEPYKNRVELLQGTLDMLILQTLQWRPRHGYAIAQEIRSGSDEVLQVETSSLYPALHRLEKRGCLRAAWGTTENRQRARTRLEARTLLHRSMSENMLRIASRRGRTLHFTHIQLAANKGTIGFDPAPGLTL